jgi:hypothetical protein
MRTLIAFTCSALALSACVGPPDGARPRNSGPKLSLPNDKETRTCVSDLNKLKAQFSLLPEQDFGGGCSIKGSVQLFSAPVPITAVKAVRCPLARTLTEWVREDAQPLAIKRLGSRIVRIDSMGGYSCRRVVGNAASANKMSQHATGNAVDIGAFVLADGRRVSVKQGWSSADEDERKFLRDVRAAACKRFTTVLSPDYNAAHHDHLHFDMGGKSFCR